MWNERLLRYQKLARYDAMILFFNPPV